MALGVYTCLIIIVATLFDYTLAKYDIIDISQTNTWKVQVIRRTQYPYIGGLLQ